MNRSSVDVMNRGMQCLMEKLGIVEAEQLDYTKWQREHFDNMSREEIETNMLNYAKRNPFTGDPKAII